MSLNLSAQNPLFIPPFLEGPVFDLVVQPGFTQFWPGVNTPTFGINGNLLGPTLIFNQGEEVTLNVVNSLNTSTTMHWHGMHLAPENDGGPHQSIASGATWSPQFEVMNNAGTFWYHPHGAHKTDLHVSKGLAGMIIVRDDEEAALDLPRTYGVDDFPIIVQSKSFDILNQIQIATQADTLMMVNGTVNPMLDVPAQMVRLRMLDGASERSFMFGFSNDMNFYQIASDGGLLTAPFETNRLRLSPGERAELLVDFSGLQGQTVYLMSYSSELANGIIGAQTVGMMSEPEGYSDNPYNGLDFELLQFNVQSPTADAINSVPPALTSIDPIPLSEIDVERTFTFGAMEPGPTGMVQGPFAIDNVQFDMEVINEIVQLNNTELWTLINQTQIAHPFHIHDVQFQIVEYNGANPPPDQQGWKDVVLVMPMNTVSFITKFENFADPIVPYMYHCHLLHHEDEGMMGSFLVVEPTAVSETRDLDTMVVYPNPSTDRLVIQFNRNLEKSDKIKIMNVMGEEVHATFEIDSTKIILNISHLAPGYYAIMTGQNQPKSFIKQ